MHLKPNEKIEKLYRHHPFPYLIGFLEIVAGSVPFYFLAFLFRSGMSESAFFIAIFIITLLLVITVIYHAAIYWLDHLVVTNFRVVHINWKFFTLRKEYEANLKDIQDIETREQGIFSYLKIFDFGYFKIETAASRVTIFFSNAPDPEGIKHQVLSLKG